MNSIEFLKNKLQEIFSKFEGIKVRYENRESTNSHIIEVIPLSFFDEDKNYMIEEEKLESEFELLYPDENIVFISEDSLTKIKRPDLKLGYDKIVYDCDSKNMDYEMVSDYFAPIYVGECNYALAA